MNPTESKASPGGSSVVLAIPRVIEDLLLPEGWVYDLRPVERSGPQEFLFKTALQPLTLRLGFALFLTLRGSDGEGGYCGRRWINTLILWQLEFE